jgi:hypothetical protein
MAPPTDPATAQLINLQLNAHEQGRVAWQGQLWPGQDLQWEIERDPPDADGKRSGSGNGESASTWQSSLRLRFGHWARWRRASCCPATSCTSASTRRRGCGARHGSRARAPGLSAGRGRHAAVNTLAIHGAKAR